MNRRQFIKSTASTGAGILILPKIKLYGAGAPSNKLNIALIGVGGRGKVHQEVASGENVVAICDVNELALAKVAKKFPGAKQYVDWRKCLEQKDINAVICATTDFTHAFVANWSLNRNLHIYCEKPLGNFVEETRIVRANYLKRKNKVATQIGTQRHADPNFNRVRELVLDGSIGELKNVYAWGNRQEPKPGYLPAEGEPPKTLHFDLWIGPSPMHPYNPEYFSGKDGANCLNWNMYWDFGSGQIGDMGSHTIDLAWNAIDADLPTSAEATGDPFNPEVTPVKLESHFEFPANNWRGPITLSWYQGGAMPKSPNKSINLTQIDHGAMFKGSQGFLICDFKGRMVIPYGKEADMSYYKRRSKDELIPDMNGFQEEWVNACKGNLKTSCDFDYAGRAIETMLLGHVAYRAGKKIAYDSKTGRSTDCPEANEFISRKYRDGWTLDA